MAKGFTSFKKLTGAMNSRVVKDWGKMPDWMKRARINHDKNISKYAVLDDNDAVADTAKTATSSASTEAATASARDSFRMPSDVRKTLLGKGGLSKEEYNTFRNNMKSIAENWKDDDVNGSFSDFARNYSDLLKEHLNGGIKDAGRARAFEIYNANLKPMEGTSYWNDITKGFYDKTKDINAQFTAGKDGVNDVGGVGNTTTSTTKIHPHTNKPGTAEQKAEETKAGGEANNGQSGGEASTKASGGNPAMSEEEYRKQFAPKSGGKFNMAEDYRINSDFNKANDIAAQIKEAVKDKDQEKLDALLKQTGGARSVSDIQKVLADRYKKDGLGVADYVWGYKMPQTAVGAGLVIGVGSSLFGNGQKSNAELYSSPM